MHFPKVVIQNYQIIVVHIHQAQSRHRTDMGHNIEYCQAQPKLQLNKAEAELALFSLNPATHPI